MPWVAKHKRLAYENNWLSQVKCDGTGCLIWTGTKSLGYGHIRVDGKRWKAHRWLFDKFRHQLSPHLDLHHICNNKACVNPWHLEGVTRQQNCIYASDDKLLHHNKKTHCPKGHDYDGIVINEANGRPYRLCKTCQRIADKKRRPRNRYKA